MDIVMLGLSGAGKTTYVAALYYRMIIPWNIITGIIICISVMSREIIIIH